MMVDEPHYQVGTTASPAEVHEMKEGKLEEKNTDLENSTGTSAVAAEEQESNSNTAVAADLDAQKGMDEPADQSNVEFQANGGPEMNKEGAGNKDADNETQEKDDAQQARQQELDRLLWLSLPGNDQDNYYSDSDAEDETAFMSMPGPSQYTNRGRKLHTRDGIRWAHRGKLGTWTEPRKESEWHEREQRRMNAFQHANVDALLETESIIPGGMGSIWRERIPSKRPSPQSNGARKQIRTRAWNPRNRDEFIDSSLGNKELSYLNGSSMALPMLVPVLSARELLQSKLLKQTFKNPHLTALNRTALNLLESEHTMNCALGRCFSAMERIFGAPIMENHTERDKTADARSLEPMDIVPPLVHINDLFLTKEGLHVPMESSVEPNNTRVISVEEQQEILHASLESLNELYADSREYMEQLEEVRLLLADVRRNRTHMWDIIRRWALRRENQDYQASQQYHRSRSDVRKNDYGTKQHESAQADGVVNEEIRTNSNRRDWNSPSNRSRGKKRSGR